MSDLFAPAPHPAGPFSGDKILQHVDAIEDLRLGRIPAPITVEIDLTNVCNLNCPYCTDRALRLHSSAIADEAAVVILLGELQSLGCKAVILTGGGEPTLHRKFADLAMYANSLGLEVAMHTNGIALEVRSAEELLPSLSWIRFSVDAWDEESYHASKGKPLWKRLLKNIKSATDVRRLDHLPVTIGTAFLTDVVRFEHFPQAAAAMRDQGADYIQARPILFRASDPRAKTYEYGALADHLARAKELETDGFRVYASTPKYEDVHRPREYDRCYGVYFSAAIGADGEVWACCHMRGNHRFSLGNVYRPDPLLGRLRTFQEIWQDGRRRAAVYERIGDFASCMPLCRFHAQNKLMARLNWDPQHVNFL